MVDYILIGMMVAVAIASFVLSPKVKTIDGFFRGSDDQGNPPTLMTLILSQVTTWVFARSLMNAAILGFYYGIAGALAYAAYYLSFLIGGVAVDRIRFHHGFDSIQGFLRAFFGRTGTSSFNLVIAVRLLSEIFANLLVIGIIFGVAGSTEYTIAIIVIALLTLGYSMLGGLRASLKTDVLQASLLILALAVLFVLTLGVSEFSTSEIISSSPDVSAPGWVLLFVAFTQIWSYPLHDPVMMDRGFVADRETTRKSFLHAAWISILVIMAFGIIGTFAGLSKEEGEAMIATLTRILGEPTMLLFNLALVLSAISTLDSTFSSASKLAIVDMKLAKPTVANGRWAMLVFLLGGLAFLFLGSKDLFAAVAVSGTVSMFLAPVFFFCILGGRQVSAIAYSFAFALALAGGVTYMLEAGGYVSLMEPAFGVEHKYSKLLIICMTLLAGGFGAFILGLKRREESAV